MMGKLKEFFKHGEFYTHLKESLDLLNQKIGKNTKTIKKLYNNEARLVQEISVLRVENQQLKERLDRLEDRLWVLSSQTPASELVLVSEQAGKNKSKQKALSGDGE